VDQGEELVLQLGPAARDLVEEDGLRLPDGRGRLQVDEPAVLGHRVPQQVVEAQDGGVVVAEGERERLREALQDEGLRAAVGADQENRGLGRERGEDGRLEGAPPGDAERAEDPPGSGGDSGAGHGRLLTSRRHPEARGLRAGHFVAAAGLFGRRGHISQTRALARPGSGKAPWVGRPGCRGLPSRKGPLRMSRRVYPRGASGQVRFAGDHQPTGFHRGLPGTGHDQGDPRFTRGTRLTGFQSGHYNLTSWRR
jgi:hypothetical protein